MVQYDNQQYISLGCITLDGCWFKQTLFPPFVMLMLTFFCLYIDINDIKWKNMRVVFTIYHLWNKSLLEHTILNTWKKNHEPFINFAGFQIKTDTSALLIWLLIFIPLTHHHIFQQTSLNSFFSVLFSQPAHCTCTRATQLRLYSLRHTVQTAHTASLSLSVSHPAPLL